MDCWFGSRGFLLDFEPLDEMRGKLKLKFDFGQHLVKITSFGYFDDFIEFEMLFPS